MKKIISIFTISTILVTSILTGCGGDTKVITGGVSNDTVTEATKATEATPSDGAEVVTSEEESTDDVAKIEIAPDSLKGKTIAFLYQDLNTEYWVAGHQAITESLKAAGATVIEKNANQDANKQLEQVNDAIAQSVDGVIIIPQDGESADVIVKTCNDEEIPIAVFNRPPATKNGNAIVAVADNEYISYMATKYMVSVIKEKFDGTKITPSIIVGDLGDPNAIARKDGYYRAIEEESELFNTTIEIPSKWDSNVVLANLKTSFQSNPDIGLIFNSSDFMHPQVKAVLDPLGKWQKIGEANHVYLAGVDGDAGAGQMMDDGYVDATGVQDLYSSSNKMVAALIEAIQNGENQPNKWIVDKGFALTQGNMAEKHDNMWGNKIRKSKSN